jgi:cysteine desulfurase
MDLDNSIIYLDYAASTPCLDEVIDAMLPFFKTGFANPSNVNHILGQRVNDAIEESRYILSKSLNTFSDQIFWTSGATESNNLAIKGLASYFKESNPKKNHIITTQIEHKSVLTTCKELEKKGFSITYLPPNEITTEFLDKAITNSTFLVSIMWTNNETGVINPIQNIGELCKSKNIYFHIDATQAFGKLEIDLEHLNIDLLSLSGHKMYASKGVGAIFIKYPLNELIYPIIHGGGQEHNIRAGTLNSASIVGLGKAIQILDNERHTSSIKLHEIQSYFEQNISFFFPNAIINGHNLLRSSHISSITFNVKIGENIIKKIKNIACSSGSACDSADNMPSHVLQALGYSPHQSKNTIRFSFGRNTTKEEIDFCISHLKEVLSEYL